MSPEEFFISKASFSTKDYATSLKIRTDSAARSLKAYNKKGFLTKITKSIWTNQDHPHYSPYGLVPLICASEQGYVSFLSALQKHGVLSQIPQKIFIATTGHTRKLNSPIVNFEFIQMNPKYMIYGIEWKNTGACYGLATAEKALIDCLYIATRKGNRFLKLPEIDLKLINKKRFTVLLKNHPFPSSIRTKIEELFKKLLGSQV